MGQKKKPWASKPRQNRQVISQIDGKLMHPGGMLVSRAPMTQLRPTHGLGMMPQQVCNVYGSLG